MEFCLFTVLFLFFVCSGAHGINVASNMRSFSSAIKNGALGANVEQRPSRSDHGTVVHRYAYTVCAYNYMHVRSAGCADQGSYIIVRYRPDNLPDAQVFNGLPVDQPAGSVANERHSQQYVCTLTILYTPAHMYRYWCNGREHEDTHLHRW